ncbi:hypothetical protein [Halalkalibacter okhensis]|uniref:Uncharacterized protein n=1 Tax=Halalkalibacter okhensis TaxID=333138 RepID=A0A0B0IGF3_9BACI|nr:hypothetical protein [Halalkalibacter okhensis]KHF41683.1 hypothetical protein LQ50_03000 [Halalkalibacter okhensis]
MFIFAKNSNIFREGLRFCLHNLLYIFVSAFILFLPIIFKMNLFLLVNMMFLYVLVVAYYYFLIWVKYSVSYIKLGGKIVSLFTIGVFGILPNILFYYILAANINDDVCGFGDVLAAFIVLLSIFIMPIVALVSGRVSKA